jgi:hypothetical protein
MRVVATAVGYDNFAMRQPGEEFDLPAGLTPEIFDKPEGKGRPTWFEPVDGLPKAAKAKQRIAGAAKVIEGGNATLSGAAGEQAEGLTGH